MPHSSTRPLLRALCGSVLLLTACDQPDDTSDVEFRWETNACVTMQSGNQQLSAGTKGYFPSWDPTDPWRPLDEAPDEWTAALQDDFREQTEAFLVADFERDGGTAGCPRVCKEAGFRWEGEGGCVGEGSFTYEGLDYAEPSYGDSPRFQMTVHAEVEMGCACTE